MNKRLELHKTLVNVFDPMGTWVAANHAWVNSSTWNNAKSNVYFQPPESFRMTYPCIVYSRSSADSKYANNRLYLNKKKYTITVIDKNPDSPIPDKIGRLQLCRFDRHFNSDGLNHDVYTLYY